MMSCVLKFALKWTELEQTILSKVTQTQKNKHSMYSLIVDIRHRKNSLQSTTPEHLGSKEDPKRDVHRFIWEAEIDKVS